jgi:hypothetical protein
LLLDELPANVRVVLGDRHYHDSLLHEHCKEHRRRLITSQYGAYPHCDKGMELRRIYHKMRSQSIEPFNGLFKRIFTWRTQMPFKGLLRTKLFVLGATFLYQLILCYQFLKNLVIGRNIKPLLSAA